MKNNINLIILVVVLFFFPLFAEGENTEKKSFIQEIKEKITKEKEKKEEDKSKEKVEEKAEIKEKKQEKEKENKNKKEESPSEESRTKIIKEKIVEEKKKIEVKAVEKKEEKEKEKEKVKEKDKYNHDYVNDNKNKYGHDYVPDIDRKYDKKKDKDDYYSDNKYLYWGYYDDIYFDKPLDHVTYVRYDDYPYTDDSDLILEKQINTYKHPRRTAFLNSSVEAAYLGKDIRDTYGVTAKISANLYSLHFNCFYQNIFSSKESLTLYSINGGVSFTWNDFTLTPFLGAFYIEPLEEARFSYGANLQVSLPANYILDLYTLNSSYGSLNFHNFSASLNYAFYIFNIGLGYNYNNYAGESLSGPFARLSVGF
jgi:hypothetical protein